MIQVNNKVKILIFLVCIVTLVSTVNTTYSRYVSAAAGTVTTNFARWQIFVNSENITTNYGTSMTFTPVILPNEHVAANKIAPSSSGYFDIAINPTDVDVSFTYDINVNIPEDSLIKDIKVTDYAIVEGNEITENDVFDKIALDSSNLTNSLIYNNNEPDFSFKPFVIRMYFSWIDGENEAMNDETDGIIGSMIASGEDTKFEFGININFKQYIGEDSNEDEPDEVLPEDENPDENIDNTAGTGEDDGSNETTPDDEVIDDPESIGDEPGDSSSTE